MKRNVTAVIAATLALVSADAKSESQIIIGDMLWTCQTTCIVGGDGDDYYVVDMYDGYAYGVL